jgi:7-cyano-7-deazaguanine synthase
MMSEIKLVAVFSGGLDSATMMFGLAQKHKLGPENIHAISFDYGQRHRKELDSAAAICGRFGIWHDIVDLTSITSLLGTESVLVNHNLTMPEGHYAQENMKATVVPNRNMIMYSIAAGIAVADQATMLGVGVHAGDHYIYPDCRPAFMVHLSDTIVSGNTGFLAPGFHISTPFLYTTKEHIARHAYELEDWLPKEFIYLTWSCYKGGDIHCGRCGTCVERVEALYNAGIETGHEDPTAYADTEYWKTVKQDA